MWCRGRADWLTNDYKFIIDYKTTTNANPEKWSKAHVSQLGYDSQMMFYVRGIHHMKAMYPRFLFLVQENTEPFACSLVELSSAFEDIGTGKIKRAIKTWSKCLRENMWGCYPGSPHLAMPATWALYEHEEKEES